MHDATNHPDPAANEPSHKPAPEIHVAFIINGDEVTVETRVTTLLGVARDEALIKSKNTGRPFTDWEISTENGMVLDPNRTFESYGFTKNVTLLLNVVVGAGG